MTGVAVDLVKLEPTVVALRFCATATVHWALFG
jgi:hypothetical protein